MISDDTSCSFDTFKMPCQRGNADASVKIWFISSTVLFRFARNVISEIEPADAGTRNASPSNFPTSSGTARVTAIAAPVVDGAIFKGAERPRRKSVEPRVGPSTMLCVAVYAWTVERVAFKIPGFSERIWMMGEAEFVVHEAFEVIGDDPRSLSFTPIRTVRPPEVPSASFAGA